MMIELVAAVLVVAVAAVAALWYVRTRNRFAGLGAKMREADSGIDDALAQRYDTLAKMLGAAKAYTRRETEMLARSVTLRQGMPMERRSQANSQMDDVLGKINDIAESYPALKSSEKFRKLHLSIRDIEERLQAAGRSFNAHAAEFNQLLASWPASIVGRELGLRPQSFFNVGNNGDGGTAAP